MVAVTAMVVVAALVAGCGGGGGQESLTVDGERVSVSRLTGAVDGLCDAREQAAGDLAGARSSFYDRSHEMLHTIANALEPLDRAQAARLLEAKQAVEADLVPTPAPPGLVPDLSRLIDVTRGGLDRLQVQVAACPA